jgi:chaperonin GroES
VATGPGTLNDNGDRVPLEVSKGDIVMYGKYSGTEVNVDGNDYLILRESDVLAILG